MSAQPALQPSTSGTRSDGTVIVKLEDGECQRMRPRSPDPMPIINAMEVTLRRIRERNITDDTYGLRLDSENPANKNLTCAVCLDVFVGPKILPCYHTFCTECIAGLSRLRAGKPIKCPSCRRETTLPAGGAQALQRNFYIRQEDLDNAAKDKMEGNRCAVHPQQLLDLFCDECDQLMCYQCVWTKHRDHNVKNLKDAAKDADTRCNLENHKKVLANLMREVARHADVQQQEQADFEARMAAIIQNLEDRRDTMLAAVKKCYDEALEDIKKGMEDLYNSIVKNAKFASSYETFLTRLQKILESATTTKSKAHMVEADREMRVGFGSTRAVEELLKQRTNEVHRPSPYFKANTSDLITTLKDYLGTVVDKIVVKQDPALVTITEKCRLGDDYDTEVFSICPKDDGTLTVSYQRRALNENAPSEGVDEKGKRLHTRQEATGMITWKSRGDGKGIFLDQPANQRRTYSKGQNQLGLLRLDTSSSPDMADVKKEIMTSETTSEVSIELEVQIKCGLHRAFDVDSTNTFFAVLEEPKVKGDFFRTVLLFRRGQAEPADIYVPEPGASFAPSDVCFMQLGPADQVLVVADEWNDCLHVLSYQEGKLRLRGQLDPAYPYLLQPLALNTDHLGRLWVVCRGGAVFTVESKSSPIDPALLTQPSPKPDSSSAPSTSAATT